MTKQTSFKEAKRIVIKIGSALLVDSENHALRHAWLETLADDIAACRKRGQEVILVSSGSIALGRNQLGLANQKLSLDEKQAAAACGQSRLVYAYQEALAHHKIEAAQILLTLGNTEKRQSYLNIRATLRVLLKQGIIPVINENDTVATAEIRYGDNDRLAARVAAMMEADCLVLLSDVDGLYTADPTQNPSAEFLTDVHDLTPEIMAMGGDAQSSFGTGGMATKLEAARIATKAGGAMIITRGNLYHPIARLLDNQAHTVFHPSQSTSDARKTWIAGSLNPKGKMTLDDGACAALQKGKSLLAAGVTSVTGNFDRGDLVALITPSGQEIAHGLSAYSASEAEKIKGQKSSSFEELLGYHASDEMIHRDDLVLV